MDATTTKAQEEFVKALAKAFRSGLTLSDVTALVESVAEILERTLDGTSENDSD